MFGSNYYGQTYYGQGPAVGTSFTLHSVDATVTTTASITLQVLINKVVDATVTTTASILRQFNRTLEATALATTATLTTFVVKALNIQKGSTKFLTLITATRSLNQILHTVGLDLVKTTKKSTTD